MTQQKYHTVIITAGISSLDRKNLLGHFFQDQGLLANPGAISPSNISENSLAQVKELPAQALPAIQDPTRVSAEFSLCHALRVQGQLSDRPKIYLVTTGSPDGQLAAQCNRLLFQREFQAEVEIKNIGDFNVHQHDDFRFGLGNILNALAEILESQNPHGTCYAPIGGYKAMTALSYLLGCIHGYPSIYLHETDQVLHEIPAVPIRIQAEDLEKIAPFIRKLQLEGSPLPASSDQEKQLLQQWNWLFETTSIDGKLHFILNAFSLYLIQRPEYQRVLAPRWYLSAEMKNQLERQARPVQTVLGKLLDQLTRGGGQSSDIYHEREWLQRLEPGEGQGWHLLKSGEPFFRFTWRKNAEAGWLAVDRVWTDHKKYDADAVSALKRKFDISDFTDCTDLIYPQKS